MYPVYIRLMTCFQVSQCWFIRATVSCHWLVTFLSSQQDAVGENEQRKKQEEAMREKLLAQEAKQHDPKVQFKCTWLSSSDIYSVLNKALRCAKKHSEYPLCWFRSRPRRRGSSSMSSLPSCGGGRPKTTGLCTRARTALLRTSSQVGQTAP